VHYYNFDNHRQVSLPVVILPFKIIMNNRKKWIVTTSDKNVLDDVKNKVIENGFVVDQVLEEIGCITGSANEEIASRLRTIQGVVDVSPLGEDIDIGPPDAPITW
jgi:hypothetical protein